jgi:hypothetical protein
MNEQKAKKQLAKMLGRFTAGSILHLLADIHRESAREADRVGDDARSDQCKLVEHTLVVVGAGIDAVQPQ